MSEKNELLYQEGEEPKKSNNSRYIKIISLCVLGVGFLFLASNIFSQKPITQNDLENIREAQERESALNLGKTVADLYEKEKSMGQVEKSNYGLKEGKSGLVLTGKLIFSAKELGLEASPYIQSFFIDLKNPFNYSILYPELSYSAMLEFVDSKSTDIAFVYATSTKSLDKESDQAGIHRYDSKTKELQSYTSTQGERERNLNWSKSSKKLVFNRALYEVDIYADLLPIKNWETVVMNPETDTVENIFQESWQPQWSPDGTKILFLKSDGLYLASGTSTDITKVVSIPEVASITTMNMIALSPDGKKLIWTAPKAGIITFYNITSWDTFEIVEVARLQKTDIEFYWPIFSPDGNFYAVQAIDSLKEEDFERKNPRIEFRGVDHIDPTLVFNLTTFDFNQMFTDAWIE